MESLLKPASSPDDENRSLDSLISERLARHITDKFRKTPRLNDAEPQVKYPDSEAFLISTEIVEDLL